MHIILVHTNIGRCMLFAVYVVELCDIVVLIGLTTVLKVAMA
jgi:hypothetical protein